MPQEVHPPYEGSVSKHFRIKLHHHLKFWSQFLRIVAQDAIIDEKRCIELNLLMFLNKISL